MRTSRNRAYTSFQGYTEVRYDEERKRVVYEPLQLTQAFRYASQTTSIRLHAFTLLISLQQLRFGISLGTNR